MSDCLYIQLEIYWKMKTKAQEKWNTNPIWYSTGNMRKQCNMTEIGLGWFDIVWGILILVEAQPRPISKYRGQYQTTRDLFQKYLTREIFNHPKHFEIGRGAAETYFKMLRMIKNLPSQILFILRCFWIIALCYIKCITWEINYSKVWLLPKSCIVV